MTEKKQKDEVVKKEIETIVDEFDKKRVGIKLDNYLIFIESILDKWNHKSKDADFYDFLVYNCCRIFEVGLKERELSSFSEKITSDNKTNLMKLCNAVYERISLKKDVLSIRPTKVINVHNKLISSEGSGGVARSIFSIQK